MKTRLTFSKGLIAISLLSSISCMDKGFQTRISDVNDRAASTENMAPVEEGEFEDLRPWPGEDQDMADPIPVEENKKSSPTNERVITGPKKEDQKQEDQKQDNSNAEESTKKEKSPQVETPKAPEKNPAVGANASDFTGPGALKPTIYYFPTFNEDDSKCEKNTMMHATGGKEMLLVCEKTAKECGLQGSCAIIQNGVTRSFNVLGARNGQDRFFEIKDGCKYGFGVENSCLDPFYTLAADLTLYEPGQVIFVPAVVGTLLPDGSKHSGYFVIRDRGRGVTGTGRFDFFSGMMAWKDAKNPFTKMGLGDVKTNIPYFKVRGKTAQQVLRHRAFPKLPAK